MEAKILRSRARANLAGNWGVSVAVALVASLLGGLITGGSFLPDLQSELTAYFPFLQKIADTMGQGIQMGRFTFSLRGGILGFAAFIIGGVLQIGYADFLLKQHDGKEVSFNDLFSKFDFFGTGFAQRFLRGLYTTLWTLLFIIPGIIKGYAYAMTPFLLAEHPELTASRAIELSEQLMDGHKAELFFLELSFIGWDLLAVLTMNLGHLFLNPYKNAAHAAFYRQLQAEHKYTICE